MDNREEWITDQWYLAVTCRNCGAQFAFQPEREIDESTYFTDSGRIVVTCPDCRFPMDYSDERIKRSRQNNSFNEPNLHSGVNVSFTARPTMPEHRRN